MSKVWIIARTEYLNAVRSKAFIIGIIMMPILMVGSIAVQRVARDKIDIRERRFAVWDQSGLLYPALVKAADLRNSREIYEWSQGKKTKQVRPAFVPESFNPGQSPKGTDPTLFLSDRVRRKEIFAFILIGPEVMAYEGGGREILYHTETMTFAELPEWLEKTLNETIQQLRIERANLDRALLQKITRPAVFSRMGLVKTSATGQVSKAEREQPLLTFGVPVVSMFLLFMMVMSSVPTLLTTVLEEKVQKIAEVLLSAVTPFQFILGKLSGAILVAMTLSGLYLGAVIGLAWKFGFLRLIPPSLFFWFVLFEFLALVIYGSIYSAIGAACNEVRDAQSLMFPATIFIMIPMFTWMHVLQSPNGAFARAVSLFPPATPMLMMLRIAIAPGPPWWEIVLSIVLTGLFMLGCFWASAKIFRIGILAQGQSPSWAKMVSWLMSR